MILLATGLAALAMFLPFFSVDGLKKISATAAGGWLPLAALVGATAIVLTGDRRESLGGTAAIAAAAAASLALVTSGALVIDGTIAARETSSLGVAGSVGTGLWLLVAAALIAVSGVAVALSKRLS